jgi:hypothetical protein
MTVGAVVGTAAVIAAPIVMVGLIAGGVDASSGANFDFWPNPALVQLDTAKPEDDHQAILVKFEQLRQTRKLTIEHTPRQQKRIKERAEKVEAARAKAERKAARAAKFEEQKAKLAARRKANSKAMQE